MFILSLQFGWLCFILLTFATVYRGISTHTIMTGAESFYEGDGTAAARTPLMSATFTTADGESVVESSARSGRPNRQLSGATKSSDAMSIQNTSVNAAPIARDQLPTNNDTKAKPVRSSRVDAYVECGIAEDGITDDGPELNACLTANAGKHVMLRKRGAPNAGGGTPTSVDIYSSQTVTMVGNAQHLDCEVPSLWSGGCRINFDPKLIGPGIAVPPTAQGVEISNLELHGGNCWSAANLATYVLPPRINGWGNDGILLAGGEPKLENVIVACFKRHGIHLSGDSTAYAPLPNGYSQPDFFRFERVEVTGNRGYGLYAVGADSNAGLATFVDARGNQLGGIYDFSVLGNTWVSPGMHANTRDPVKAGATQPVSSIRITGNAATITTVGPLAKGLGMLGTWITTTDSTDSSLNVTCMVMSLNAGAKQLTCPLTHADGFATGGTVGTASSTSVYFTYASTDDGSGNSRKWKIAGPYSGRGGSSTQVVVNPYCEIDEQSPDFGDRTLVLGGNCWMLDTNGNHGGVRPSNGGLAFDGNNFIFHGSNDKPMFFDLWAGDRANASPSFRFLDKDGKPRWRMSVDATGNFRLDNNGTIIPLETADKRIFIGGVAYVDAAGKGTFPGGLNAASVSGVTSTAVVSNLNADMVDGKHLTLTTVPFVTTPIFDAGEASTFKMTLTSDVTSSVLSRATAGQLLNFIICQDGIGGRTFRWPSNARGGMLVGTNADKCSVQSFVFDGNNAYATSSGVMNQ